MKVVHGKRRRPFKRLAALITLTGIFLFGAAAGLFTSAWMDNNPRYTDAAKAAVADLGINMPAASASSADKPQEFDSAPASEEESARPPLLLPRIEDDDDVAEQMPTPALAPTPTPTPSQQPPPSASAPNPSELSGSSAATQSANSPPLASVPPAAPAKSDTKPAEEESVSKQSAFAPEPDKTEAPPVASTPPRPATPAVVQSSQAKPKRQSIPKKAQSQSQAQKEHEIERIKRQAGEELRRKPTMDDGAARATTRSRQGALKKAAMRRIDRRALVLQCERVSNILRRERCKWDVCGGKWGKEGCPSYDPPHGMF